MRFFSLEGCGCVNPNSSTIESQIGSRGRFDEGEGFISFPSSPSLHSCLCSLVVRLLFTCCSTCCSLPWNFSQFLIEIRRLLAPPTCSIWCSDFRVFMIRSTFDSSTPVFASRLFLLVINCPGWSMISVPLNTVR